MVGGCLETGAPGALDTSLTALSASASRFTDVLRRADGDLQVPHLEWTVSEVGAHVLAIFRAYLAMSDGAATLWHDPARIAEGNRLALEATREREPAEVADALDRTVADLLSAYRNHVGLYPWNGGLSLAVRSVAGMNLAETEVHGWDLAAAMKERWPISREHAVLAIDAAIDAAPLLVDPAKAKHRHATVELRLRRGPTYRLQLRNAELTIERARTADRPDCYVSADPATYLLSSYGRIGDIGPALRGQIAVWGRRPWKAFVLESAIRNP